MSSPDAQIAMTVRAEPGWRVVLRKPLQRPPKPEDMPEEELYKLVVQPIRFWGFTVPVFNEGLRRKPVVPSVPAALFSSGHLMVSAVETLRKEEVVQPIPLGKSRKKFDHLVDIVGPKETDEQALERIESILAIQREIERTKAVMLVMES